MYIVHVFSNGRKKSVVVSITLILLLVFVIPVAAVQLGELDGDDHPHVGLLIEGSKMADFTLQALHDEIEADPWSIGYKEASGDWKGDQEIADLINAKNYTVDRLSVPMEEVRAGVTYDAYNDLARKEQEWLCWMTPNSGDFQVTADMKLQLTGRSLTSNGVAGTGNDSQSFWGSAHQSDMALAMLDLIEVPGGRAEVLWGQGKSISLNDVSKAANL